MVDCRIEGLGDRGSAELAEVQPGKEGLARYDDQHVLLVAQDVRDQATVVENIVGGAIGTGQ